MTKRSARSPISNIQQIAQGQPGLASAIRQAEAFSELNRRIQPKLPIEARAHICIACVDGDRLVIAAASPVWATKARMLAHELLIAANELWPQPLQTTKVLIESEVFASPLD